MCARTRIRMLVKAKQGKCTLQLIFRDTSYACVHTSTHLSPALTRVKRRSAVSAAGYRVQGFWCDATLTRAASLPRVLSHALSFSASYILKYRARQLSSSSSSSSLSSHTTSDAFGFERQQRIGSRQSTTPKTTGSRDRCLIFAR